MCIKTTLALLSTAVIAAGVMAPAAYAEDTLVTVEVTGDPLGLAISVPATAGSTGSPLDTAVAGEASVGGSLGDVTVTDTRAALVADWEVTVSTTTFTTGGASANETISKANVGYSSGAGLAEGLQVGVFTPIGTAVAPAALDTDKTGSWAGTGNNTVTWTPDLTLTLLDSQVAGEYDGTIMHSVL